MVAIAAARARNVSGIAETRTCGVRLTTAAEHENQGCLEYSGQFKCAEISQIMTDAQFVAGAVMRQFSDRSKRSDFTVKLFEKHDYQERFYSLLSR